MVEADQLADISQRKSFLLSLGEGPAPSFPRRLAVTLKLLLSSLHCLGGSLQLGVAGHARLSLCASEPLRQIVGGVRFLPRHGRVNGIPSVRGVVSRPSPDRTLAGSYLAFASYAVGQLEDIWAVMAMMVVGMVVLALVGLSGCRRSGGQAVGVTVAQVLNEATEMTAGSIRFAQRIGHAASGDRLGRITRETMEAKPGLYASVRSAVQARLNELGGAGQSIGLFMLTADMATTAAVAGDGQLDSGERRELRHLWDELRSQR